jgi:hypothetical protein
MLADDILLDAREFFAQHVGALDELALLLMLLTSTARWWTAGPIGQHLGITEARAGQILERFASANLLDIKITEDICYRFQPGTPDLDARTRALLMVYREQPAVVLGWVAGLGDGSVKDFAEFG